MSELATMLSALGLPSVTPEPEVLRADLARIQSKALANIIAALVNDNEPMLSAKANGNTITVSERGGPATFTFTIQQSPREPVSAQQAAGGNS
jgi:hypothetical protein